MNCPALDGYFSNTVCDQFNLFSLLIKKLAGGPRDDVIHGVMLWPVCNHFGSIYGCMLRESDATTALGAEAALQMSSWYGFLLLLLASYHCTFNGSYPLF